MVFQPGGGQGLSGRGELGGDGEWALTYQDNPLHYKKGGTKFGAKVGRRGE